MFNGQYKSIRTIIENILRDNDYYNDMSQDDATEWAIRAMELIGAPLVYTETISTITVTNYRATLPDGLRTILGVRDHTSRQTLVSATSEYIMQLYNEQVTDPADDGLDPVIPEDELKMKDKKCERW